jgi:hypothetical protein
LTHRLTGNHADAEDLVLGTIAWVYRAFGSRVGYLDRLERAEHCALQESAPGSTANVQLNAPVGSGMPEFQGETGLPRLYLDCSGPAGA